jgi:hypothetical protein
MYENLELHVINIDTDNQIASCNKSTESQIAETLQYLNDMKTQNQDIVMANSLVNTPGISFNITYNKISGNIDQNSIINGITIEQLINTYLSSWGPNIYANGFVVDLLINFVYYGNVSVLASAGPFISSISNNNSNVRQNFFIPDSYLLLNASTNTTQSYNSTNLSRAIRRFWGISVNDTNPDIVMNINTFYMGDGTGTDLYDYSDNFVVNSNKLPFKTLIIHEIHHGLGFTNFIMTTPLLFNYSMFRNINLPTTNSEYNDGNRIRIASNGSGYPIPENTYGNISISYLGICEAPIDNQSPSHLKRTSMPPRNGIMEPFLYVNGMPWTINDASGLACVGWNNNNKCCFSEKSKVQVKNIKTGEIEIVKLSDLTSDDFLIYDIKEGNYVPIKYNIVMNSTNKFVLIKKDTLEKNVPDEDLYNLINNFASQNYLSSSSINIK